MTLLKNFFDGSRSSNICAVELFAAARCNLKCVYCYIPYVEKEIIDKKHNEIIKEAQEIWPLINKLKKVYDPNDITSMSHWGTEPTLTIEYFKDYYKEAIKEFPNLENVSMSSNFMTNINKLIDFVNTFPTDRKINFDLQVSLDGPPWITDVNRRGGGTDKIISNLLKFIKNVDKNLIHSISMHFKPTMPHVYFERCTDPYWVLNYYKFFDDLCCDIVNVDKYRKIRFSFCCDPTLECHTEATQKDGINLNKFYENIQKVKKENRFKYVTPDLISYYGAFNKLMLLGNEFFTKQKMFTCSAGDTQFGIGDFVSPCHDPFFPSFLYCNENNVDDIILDDKSKQEVKNGKWDIIYDNQLVEIDGDNEKTAIFLYKYRGFHDFVKFRLSTTTAMVKEVAYTGQISECYKTDDMSSLLAIYLWSRHSCPVRSELDYGSVHLPDWQLIRLFGNGLLENFVKRYLGGKNDCC